jgi:argininosuccinate lyase
MSRFSEPQHGAFRRLNDSIAFDWRLASYDLQLSRAHVAALADAHIISAADREALARALDAVAREVQDGTFPFSEHDEDVHMAIERRVTELAGPVGGKLHTARSRNDQVATDTAMYVRVRANVAIERVGKLAGILVRRAQEHLDWPMPGYTHLQRAQPVYLSHHLLAYVWMLVRDRRRFQEAAGAAAALPLGAGALAGVNFEVDRGWLARQLGFETVAPNSIDAVSNRDFVLDYLAAAATCATHLSRLSAEVVLWSSQEFGFAELADSWASGSSIMPQKKNPDAAELVRAKAPRIAAHLIAVHGVLHGLPLAYNKDFQEDKEHLFDAADTLELCLEAMAGMVESLSFDRARLEAAATDEFLAATDIADLLVGRGVPFREAHGIVGALVRLALEQGRELSEISPDELARLAPQLGEEFYSLLKQHSWLESKRSEGGTSLERVREQLERARAELWP